MIGEDVGVIEIIQGRNLKDKKIQISPTFKREQEKAESAKSGGKKVEIWKHQQSVISWQ